MNDESEMTSERYEREANLDHMTEEQFNNV